MENITFAPAILQGRVRIPIGGDSPRAERQEPLELRHRQYSRRRWLYFTDIDARSVGFGSTWVSLDGRR